MQQEQLSVIRVPVEYNGGVKTAYLPANASVVDIKIHVTTAFNGSGADTVAVGITGTAGYFCTGVDVSSAGAPSVTVLKGGIVQNASGSKAIIVTYTDANGDSSAGAAQVFITVCQHAS